MIKRIAKQGPYSGTHFFGCSKYPMCKGIVNMPDQPVIPTPPVSSDKSSSSNEKNNMESGKVNIQPKTPLTEKQKFVFTKLRDQLLDISTSNRSVRINHLYDIWAFDLYSLTPEFGSDYVNEILEASLKRKPIVKLIPLNPKKEHVIRLSERLTKLYRNINEIEIEKGIYDLNIGFPFLRGLTVEGKIIQAPILLMPARLEKHFPAKGEPYWVIQQDKTIPVVFNKTLLLALSKFNRSKVKEEIFDLEVPEELYGKDNFMDWVSKTLNEFGVSCELSEDARDNEIDKLPEFNVEDFQKDCTPGDLKIKQSAVLGHFPQANSSMLKDYEYFLTSSQEEISNLLPLIETELDSKGGNENLAYANIENSIQSDELVDCIDKIPERENVFLLASDSSQDKIILDLYNESIPGVVIWGPPGTGKSQTIVNLIGHCLSKKMTVLVVCQKRAALDVVYDRMHGLGLSQYVASVHDSRKDRKKLYEKLEQHSTQAAELKNPENFHELSDKIQDQTKKLGEVYSALNARSSKHFTPLELYQEKRIDSHLIFQLPENCLGLNALTLKPILIELDAIQKTFLAVGLQHPWRLRKSFHSFGNAEQKILVPFLNEILKQESDIENSISVLREFIKYKSAILSKRKYQPDFPSDFTSLLLTAAENNGFLKWIFPSNLIRKKQIKNVRSGAQNLISAFKSKLKTGLENYLNEKGIHQIFKEIDGHINPIPTVKKMRDALLADFENIISLDRQYQSLAKSSQSCVEKLLFLIENSELTPSVKWSDIVKSSFHEVWIDEIERSSPIPNEIHVGIIDSTISDYRKNIDTKYSGTAKWLSENMGANTYAPENIPLLKKIKGYVTKKRNIPSIRKMNDELLEHGYHKITTPCWLASPETVSDIFPIKKDLFDVVIFDEASQCPVKNAMPSIFRGKKIFVAGDEKQLPPLTLFETSHADGYVGTFKDIDALDASSLLNLANRLPLYKDAPLNWHYRSEHEELIAFSNHAFYNGQMRTCPNCKPYNSTSTPAIKWTRANGYWVNRCNEVEADLVVEKIFSYIKENPNNTLGVITFNAEQKEIILDKIDKRCQEDEEFKDVILENKQHKVDDQLFVKNIENVQGDERDVIIFSIAYAPSEPGGRVVQQYGLLSQEGGENRLNVAITRAKKEIHVICSVEPETDLDSSKSLNLGPKRFKQYLTYAKAVAEKDAVSVHAILSDLNPSMKASAGAGVLLFESPFEEDVYSELRKRNFSVHSQVGQSGFRIDLAVVDPADPTRYVVGIECDGAKYHSSQSARDRDVFRQKFLERRGWKIYRIWSTRWWRDKKREMVNFETFLRSLNSRPDELQEAGLKSRTSINSNNNNPS